MPKITVLLAAGIIASTLGASGPGRAAGVPALSHVFVIVEENTNFSDVFGAHKAEAPFLNALADAHVRHDAYYGTSHVSLGNYISMVSGQMPSVLDHIDCPPYPLCVRPGPTIGKQLDTAGKSWRGYFTKMPAPCTHPSGLIDTFQSGYATRHNPFVYFSEIVHNVPYCKAHDVPYETSFAADLAAGPRTLSYIVPDTCNDGHDAGCMGNKTQIQILDEWLAANVPPILSYVNSHPGSALFVTFDEASPSDTSGCCNQFMPFLFGGGHVGLVMVAPGLERSGYRSHVKANHYSLLRTIEAGFGLPPLAKAAQVPPMADLFL